MADAPLRKIELWDPVLEMEARADGAFLIRQAGDLPPHAGRVTEALARWAAEAPDRTWLAQRGPDGAWQRLSYAEGLARVRALGQAFLDLGLGPERPVAILSGASIAHALVAVAAQHVGVPSAAVAPAYALVSEDFAKLRGVLAQITPGLIFMEDGAPYARAMAAAAPADAALACVRNPLPGALDLARLEATAPTAAVDAAHAAVGPETIAKFMFTSGTTGAPKAVIQTHGNICANQAMAADCYRFVRATPPVILDWAPWNHVAAGTKVFNLALFNGGTYFIDEGKPGPGAIEATIRNIRDVRPTWYFNVPAGWELLVDRMEEDAALRDALFARLQYLMYAGAGMPQHVWDRIAALSVAATGERVLRSSTLGSTETGPFALCGTQDLDQPGNVGVPARGLEMKLAPMEGRLELRLRGPSITPGYHRDPERTAEAFDEEGFYRLGDALRFAEPGDPAAGFVFDGRLAENFKLRTGTWVATGPVRAALVDAMQGLARDAVLSGEDRDALGALLVPFLPALRALVPAEAGMTDAEVLHAPEVRARTEALLAAHAAAATGSASRVVRAMWLEAPPSFDAGEATDKGSINQRAVLRNRPELVEALHGAGDPRVIRVDGRRAA